MKTKYFISLLPLVIWTSGLFAQNMASNSLNTNRFFLGVNFGTGHAAAQSFMDERITDHGYTTISGMMTTKFDIGYNVSENWTLLSGYNLQALSLSFVFDNNSYRYNGYRSIIPLGFRRYFDPITLPARVFVGLGGYYTFDHDASLISDVLGFEAKNVFDGFGMLATLGFTYSTSQNTGFTLSYNILADLTGNFLLTRSGYFSFGLYSELF